MDVQLEALRGLDYLSYITNLRRFAVVFSLLGEDGEAIRYLSRCMEASYGECTPALLRLDPWWDYLAVDPRFVAMLRRFEQR